MPTQTPPVALLLPAPPLQAAAKHWSERLQLPVVDSDPAYRYELLLRLHQETGTPGYRLALHVNAPKAPGPVYVDLVGGATAHRRRFGGGRGQPLARAIGLKGGASPSVADLTAGLGRDAFVFASLGCQVQLVERVPVVAALLENGLARAAADLDVGPLVARMALSQAESGAWLAQLTPERRPDVIYLDPMYPARSKQALVKKEMQLLHRLVGTDPDAPALLEAALGKARKRVVVKRPRTAPSLSGPAPQFAIESPNTRYDVYPVS